MPDVASERPHLRTRARIAAHRKNHPDVDAPVELYRDHAAARLENYIRQVVDAAPPLTSAQRDRIATLLRPSASAGGDAA